ncbi:hypothetical protein GIB67_027956 [Kingdonia uniflora]|uniref:KIB1-4 beta-propeller domain-containing protein n=1 Tax=Kingdonia uniflora TaxID=39325 RepID=A0A7J7LGU6_9MAGN|nr:hypothetical protein GIB67_027956 [Kingdonia uniflora]
MVGGHNKTGCVFLSLEQGHGGKDTQQQEKTVLELPHDYYCCGSTGRWLVYTDDKYDMHLYNPFSGANFQLPSATTLLPPLQAFRKFSKYYVENAVLSSNPTTSPSDTIVLIIYLGGPSRLAFCRLGDKAWTTIESPGHHSWYTGITYHKGQFYIVNSMRGIDIFDINTSSTQFRSIQLTPTPPSVTCNVEGRYLVELEDYNTSFSLKVSSDIMACNRNCIYFTNDDIPFEDMLVWGCEVGLYNLENQSFEVLYENESTLCRPPPIWITPFPHSS